MNSSQECCLQKVLVLFDFVKGRYSKQSWIFFLLLVTKSLALSLQPQTLQIDNTSATFTLPFNHSTAPSSSTLNVPSAVNLTIGDIHCEGRDVGVFGVSLFSFCLQGNRAQQTSLRKLASKLILTPIIYTVRYRAKPTKLFGRLGKHSLRQHLAHIRQAGPRALGRPITISVFKL